MNGLEIALLILCFVVFSCLGGYFIGDCILSNNCIMDYPQVIVSGEVVRRSNKPVQYILGYKGKPRHIIGAKCVAYCAVSEDTFSSEMNVGDK